MPIPACITSPRSVTNNCRWKRPPVIGNGDADVHALDSRATGPYWPHSSRRRLQAVLIIARQVFLEGHPPKRPFPLDVPYKINRVNLSAARLRKSTKTLRIALVLERRRTHQNLVNMNVSRRSS